MRRRKGFTLIELLVVIAIIGILAAMVFPVFARARESARKAVCLSNVKNIALAIQMYLNDYNAFFPIGYENDAFADEFFKSRPWRSSPCDDCDDNHCNHIRQANPYAREPVILDEYVRNREVWNCPSAKVTQGPGFICPAGRNGYWVNNFVDHVDTFYTDWMAPPCIVGYPSGWGGTITDSFVQGPALVDGESPQGAFISGIGINDNMHWATPQSIDDPVKYVAIGDNGTEPYPWNIQSFAWPDVSLCGFGDATDGPCGTDPGCCGTADYSGCPWSAACGLDFDGKVAFREDPSFRRSKARHMGGVNLGFVDGHAKWFMSETCLWQSPPAENAIFEGMCHCPCDWTKNYCVGGKPV